MATLSQVTTLVFNAFPLCLQVAASTSLKVLVFGRVMQVRPPKAALRSPLSASADPSMHVIAPRWACTQPMAARTGPLNSPRAPKIIFKKVAEGSGRLLVLAAGERSKWGRTMAMFKGFQVSGPVTGDRGQRAAAGAGGRRAQRVGPRLGQGLRV